MSEEILQAKENLMIYIQTFLKKFSRIPFRETPKVLSRAWNKFFEIQHAQPEDTHELLRKLLKDLQIISEELAEYINSQSWNRPAFYNNDDEYSIQYKEYLENSSNAIAPVLPTENLDNSLSIGDKHLSTIPKTKTDEEIKSSVEDLVSIPSESEGISDYTCDVPFCDNSHSLDVLRNHSDIFFDFNNDCTSSDDVSFKDIDYVKASPPNSKLVSLEKVKNYILCEKLLNINLLIAYDLPSSDDFYLVNSFEEKPMTFSNPLFGSNDDFISSDDESLSDEDVPKDNVKIYSNPLFEFNDEYISSDVNPPFNEVLENIESKDFYDPNLDKLDLLVTPLFDANKDECFDSGGDVDEINDIENDDYDTKRDIYFLEEFLSNDTPPLPKNESSNFDHHDDLSFSRPPPEPPDVEVLLDLKPDTSVLSAKVVEDISEHHVLMPKILPTQPTLCLNIDTLLLISSENEDKVFKPGILSYLLVSHQEKTTSNFFENQIMMYGGDISLLGVLYLHFYPP
nr:hypothetical protein [Tanacetum cinerariifolium]